MHKYSYFDPNWLVLKINNQNVAKQLHRIFYGVVYDLGCGVRPYETDILKVADKYIGVDWGNTLHDFKVDIEADLNKPIPLESCIADTVVSFQVMEHLCEPQTMLNEAYRILKSNGNILITVPFQWAVHEAPYDYYRYTKYGLEYMFNKAGFVDVEVKEASGFWVMWFLKLNYQTARLVRGPLPLRFLIRTCMLPLWFVDQIVAPVLDKYWPATSETAGYYVVAKKP